MVVTTFAARHAAELVAQAEEAYRTAVAVPHNHSVAIIYAYQAYPSAEALRGYTFTHIMKADLTDAGGLEAYAASALTSGAPAPARGSRQDQC